MTDKLKQLYKTQILKHSQNPFNEGELVSYTHLIKAYNPVCGDQFDLYLNIIDQQVTEASFTGYGCAISKASTSVLTKQIIGKGKTEIEAFVADFLKMLDPNASQLPEEITADEELLAFAAAREFPERLSCANLSWLALIKDLI
uniref:Fe-S cluster assembly sulfur transfer protein SufU n=1 Tax=Roseivirga sp. TaxID=1964215 RepID=UPI0040472CB5